LAGGRWQQQVKRRLEMSQLRVLEVVTALVFIFYAAALISSGLVEWLANILTVSRHLYRQVVKVRRLGLDEQQVDRQRGSTSRVRPRGLVPTAARP
jgi:hypothetical protein